MNQPNFQYSSLPMTTSSYNDFGTAFSFAPGLGSYTETLSGPSSPSFHSHDDTTGDEEPGTFFAPQDDATTSNGTAKSRKRSKLSSSATGGSSSKKTSQQQPPDQILKRRVQNRAAQRSFRERQKEYVHDLEQQVDALKGEIGKLHENYQELLKAVTSAPRIPLQLQQQQQWSGDVSPATSLDEYEYAGSVESAGFVPVKTESNLWPSSIENQSLFY